MQHNYQLGDKVYFSSDNAPFTVIGIRKHQVEIEGDFSGGMEQNTLSSWVDSTKVEMYDPSKLIDGKYRAR